MGHAKISGIIQEIQTVFLENSVRLNNRFLLRIAYSKKCIQIAIYSFITECVNRIFIKLKVKICFEEELNFLCIL